MKDIAIASVPMQAWEAPYSLPEALRQGTIFPVLKKPFYVECQQPPIKFRPRNDYEAKLLEIQQVGFFITDLTLFLDTHPGQPQATAMRAELQQKMKVLRQQFAKQYYPLDMFEQGNAQCDVLPWEGGTMNVAL